eukprot:2447789-Rhodomonas_salina.1
MPGSGIAYGCCAICGTQIAYGATAVPGSAAAAGQRGGALPGALAPAGLDLSLTPRGQYNRSGVLK